ncbi:MAG: hypothetical protein ACKVWR_10985 [Acidimicrobiales bacterium]
MRFELCGAATDVLRRHGGAWIHQARHVSTTPPTGQLEASGGAST